MRGRASDPPGAARGLVPSGVRRVTVFAQRGKHPSRRLRRVKGRSAFRVTLRPGVWRFHTRAVERRAMPSPARRVPTPACKSGARRRGR
jgi:hypothetical protein